MLGLGFTEILLIFAIALLVFGPRFFQRKILSVKESLTGFHEAMASSKATPLDGARSDTPALNPGKEPSDVGK